MGRVLAQVQGTIEQHHLLSRGERVVVGVSGGPDSLCLLHILRRLAGAYDLALHVAHLHHGLRGEEADADAAYVRSIAAKWRLPCTVERADVPALARGQRLAFEETARRARYAFLSRVAADEGARTVAVGHNADDQAETVFMHWLRGAGLAGLRGMLPLTRLQDYRLLEPEPGGTAPDLRLARPLLEVTRAEILAYCDRHELAPRFDRSNLDTTYFRNWLRHEVLPLLASHNPNVGAVIRRSARVIADDYALLRSLLEEVWPHVVVDVRDVSITRELGITFDLAAWRALPTALQRSTLREAIHRLRRSLRNINFVHVEDALRVARDGATGDRATLPQGLMLTLGYDRFTVATAGASEPLPDLPLMDPQAGPLPVAVPGDTPLPGSDWLLQAIVLDRPELHAGWGVDPAPWGPSPAPWLANLDPWRAYLDADEVSAPGIGPGALELRVRRPGDRFQPLGLGGHSVKLADFFTNQKVPRTLRDQMPLLVGRAGIAWVCGQRVDERARVRASTERVLVLVFTRS